jgi:hypothetical protein
VRRFLASLPTGQVDVALEATTGWRFIVEELLAASSLTRCALSRPRVMSRFHQRATSVRMIEGVRSCSGAIGGYAGSEAVGRPLASPRCVRPWHAW